MEELKILVGMVAGLPNTAIWVLAGYLLYKVVVIGSIYGVVRFGIEKLHNWLVTRKTIPPEVKTIEVWAMLDSLCIKTEPDRLIAQLHRLRGRGTGIQSDYIHRQSVDWLREAIDDKIAKDEAAAGKLSVVKAA